MISADTSRTGNTEKMAAYTDRGVRLSGHDSDLEKVSGIKGERELEGQDGSIFG